MREEGHQLFTPRDKAGDRGRVEEGRKERKERERERDEYYRILRSISITEWEHY